MAKSRAGKSRGAALRRLMSRGCVVMPGAFNGLTARLIERIGFDAVYVSGAGLSNATAGVPDIGLLSRQEFAMLAGFIAAAVSIPAVCDADTGFGDAGKTVEAYERVGLAGLHLEDQQFPKRCGHLPGKEIVKTGEMIRKIRSAVAARQDKSFLVIARTDARSVEGFDAAVERARIYLEAGADAIFPEALESAEEFAQFARQVRAPLMANMTEFGRSPLLSVSELSRMGYRLVIFPQTALRVVMPVEEQCLRDLNRLGSQKKWIRKMQTRQALYELLGYDPKQ
jgi:methylisocitrate lyase